jgi:glutathione synthase/RimK-type ligase-like ATP-grasp enzyme
MILILSNKWDLTVDFVISELRKRNADFIRINTEDLILERATVNLPIFEILVSKKDELVDLTKSINVIWNRRPGKPFENITEGDEIITTANRKFIHDQWYSWLEVLQLISNVNWINHPQANDAMESKIRQLYIASKMGFNIPDTSITNDLQDIENLAGRNNGNIIAKALYSPLIEEADEDYFVFTNEITLGDLSSVEEIRICPSIFQNALKPKIDYRVTVIGDIVYAVEITNQKEEGEIHIDWRTKKDGLLFSLCKLPEEIEILCRKFVKENGLLFGAIDLVQYKNTFYFLEINPNGEWGWLQYPHGIPIAETLSELMINLDRR